MSLFLIIYFRNAVNNIESQGPPTFSSTNTGKIGKTSSAQFSPNGPDQVSTSVNSSAQKKPQQSKKDSKSNKPINVNSRNSNNGIAGYGNDDIDDNDFLADNQIRPTIPMGKPNGKTSTSLEVRRSSSARQLSNSNSATGIQQVTLDPSSIEYISRIINEKLEREFKARDQRLMNQVQDLVNQSLLQLQNQMLLGSPKGLPQLQPLSLPSQLSQHHHPHHGQKGVSRVRSGDEYSDVSMDSMVSHDLSRKPSSSNRALQSSKYNVDKDNTKIPRIKLPKVNNYTEKKAAGGNNPTSSRSARSISTEGQFAGPSGALPPIVPKTKQPNVNNSKPVKEELLSMDGVQYPHCRSVVYPSTQDITLLRNRHIQQQQQVGPTVLSLKHIIGYDGDANRHGGATKGKNVLWLRVKHENKIAYPAASVVIVTDVTNNQQSFFTGHSDDVTCLSQHPTLPIIASSQLGSEGVILVWNYDKLLQLHQQYGHSTMEASDYPELTISSTVRGISGVDFSGDGKLLLASSMEEIRSVYIFDWEKGIQLCSAKVGHIEVCQFKFNPFCFMPFDHDNETSSSAGSAKNSNKGHVTGIQPPTGCYTLTSFGGKQVKFWTIKAQFQTPSNLPVPNGADGIGARDYRGKQFRAKTIKYVLEGTQGASNRKGQNQVDYTACTFVGDYGEFETNKVLLGTSSGAIHIWTHLLEKGDNPHDLQAVTSWLSRGKLLAVITDAHESSIIDFDYYPGRLQQKKGGREGSKRIGEKLISSDQTGIINIWGIDRHQRQQQQQQQKEVLPLQHLGGMQLDESFARSITLNSSVGNGEQAVLGLANNSILLLQLGGIDVTQINENNESPVFDMQRIVNCHNGKVKCLAVNPVVDSIFASICSDRTVHFWDSDNYMNIGTIDLEVSATALAFSSNGVNVAVGNERGELLVLHSDQFQRLLNEKLSSAQMKKQKRSSRTVVNGAPCLDWQLVDSKVVAQGSKRNFLMMNVLNYNNVTLLFFLIFAQM
jgi:WD40 repeat protein